MGNKKNSSYLKISTVISSRCIHISQKFRHQLFSLHTQRGRPTSVLQHRGGQKRLFGQNHDFFKRRFSDYLSMATARCERNALKFDPSTQNSMKSWMYSKKQPKKLSELKHNNLLTKPHTPKCPTMSKKHSIGHTLKTSRIMTLCFTWKKK